MIRNYYNLIKPGIIYGNVITVSAGFLLFNHNFNLPLYFLTLIGISLVMGCGCVLNNLYDQDIDRLMDRTKTRVLVKGLIPRANVIVYALILGVLGLFVLYFYVNTLTTCVAFVGLFFYLIIYTYWLKRNSILGTIVGGIAGAVPPVVGYCAVVNRIDYLALSLFIVLFIWQLPHAYSISIYRLDDYKRARIPVLPVKYGVNITKFISLIFVIIFAMCSSLFVILGVKGIFYLVISQCLSLLWIILSIKAFFSKDDILWGRRLFVYSILVICVLSICLMA